MDSTTLVARVDGGTVGVYTVADTLCSNRHARTRRNLHVRRLQGLRVQTDTRSYAEAVTQVPRAVTRPRPRTSFPMDPAHHGHQTIPACHNTPEGGGRPYRMGQRSHARIRVCLGQGQRVHTVSGSPARTPGLNTPCEGAGARGADSQRRAWHPGPLPVLVSPR